MIPQNPFANVTVFKLGAPVVEPGRYPKDDFELQSGRDFIPKLETPPDVIGAEVSVRICDPDTSAAGTLYIPGGRIDWD